MGKHVEGFPDKDGIDRLVKLAKAMCAVVATFSGLILRKYPDNDLIKSLLSAIAVVCALIPEIESEFLEPEGLNEVPLEDPSGISGIDVTRPPAEDPDFT